MQFIRLHHIKTAFTKILSDFMFTFETGSVYLGFGRNLGQDTVATNI